jgi:D-cysteine desulfhydrase
MSNAERSRLSLTRLPTPVHFLKHTSELLGKKVYAWRDDLTGFIDSGNKLRKLEFLVADALQKGCDHLITCGGPQSNHTRATSAVARSLGLGVSILVVPKMGFDYTKAPTGNLLLNHLFGAEITWITPDEFQKAGSTYDPFFEKEVERVKAAGKKPYVIPLGGSNPMGCRAYESAISEIKDSPPDSLFCAFGSGGTFLGLSLGIQKYNLKTELYGINVIGENAKTYLANLSSALQKEGVPLKTNHAHLVEGYVGEAYAVASDEDLRFYRKLATEEGLVLDPCYTGKAFQGMVKEVKKDPKRYGERILFLHSGGVFGNFAYTDQYQRAFNA